jgi:hypothetical protein
MTTHDQDHGVQPGAEKDGAFASEQPRDAQDMNAYSADELLEAITRDPESSESATTSPASVQPPGQESEEQQDQGKKEKSLRLRLSALPPDQQHETAEAYRLVSEGKAADLLEALQQLRGVTAASSTPANAQDDDGTETPQETSRQQPSAIQELEDQLEGLRSQRKLARDEFDSDLEDQLTVEIENLSRRIAKEEIKAETQQKGIEQAENQFRSEYSAAVEELESQYPDVLDDNSEFTALLDEKLAAARYRNDPKLANPRYILELAQSVHALLDKPSGRRPSPPPAVPRPTGAGVAPVHNQPPRPTEDQLRAAINQASPEDLLAAIAGT